MNSLPTDVMAAGSSLDSEHGYRPPFVHEGTMGSIRATTGQTIRVLLVDDTAAVRRALRLALELEPDLEVIGEAADGEHAVLAAVALHPDIVLMDLELPGMNGIEATRHIKAAGEQGAVIMLTAFGGEETRTAAASVGVALFLDKSGDFDDLGETVRALHDRNIRGKQ